MRESNSMRESKANSIPHAAAPALPDCPLCSTPMVIQQIIPGRLGLEHWTLRCTKCGHIHQDAVDTASPTHALSA
jgi:ssDNA-binding Zn-finger/Zn-ribbon topoisomerase 1